MRRTGFLLVAVIAFLLLVLTGFSWAGQVVTQDVKSWAKHALEQEKALQAIEAKNTLAVLYFSNKTGQREFIPLQKGLALMLITDLSKVKSLQVVERVRMQALVEELGLGTSGLVAPEGAPRVGKLLQAYWLVGGDIGGDRAALQVRSDVLDVPGPKVVGRPNAEGKLAELFAIEKSLLFQIIKALGITVTPEEEEALKQPLSINPDALIALFKAIDACDEGQYDDAAGFYEEALRLDPQLLIARDGLRELESLGLIRKGASSRDLLRSMRDRTSLTDSQTADQDPTKRERTPKDLPTPVDINVIFPSR